MSSKLTFPQEAVVDDLCKQIAFRFKLLRQEHNEEYDEIVEEAHKYRCEIEKLKEENEALVKANVELHKQLKESQRETMAISNFVKNFFQERIERRFGFVKAPESSSST